MAAQVEYLSQEWLAEADAAVQGLTPVDSPLTVTMVVNGGPSGRYSYQIVLGPGQVRLRPVEDDSAESSTADVSMMLDWDVAIGVAQGRIGAQRAFLDGDIQLGGDVTRLLGHQEALATVDDRLVDLRARTDFPPSG